MRVSVDDQVSECTMNPGQNLSELLEDVVSSLPPNRIVTGVVLDGQNLQRYPAVDQDGYPDGNIKELQIRTVDREMWVANGIELSISCVERIQKSLIRAAEFFRERDKAEANRFFVHCIEGLERFIETILITRGALRLDFARIFVDSIPLSRVQDELSVILKAILECQEKEDFIGVADRVEYELLTNLSAWGRGLRQLRLSSISNA